jgi:hypothetical protein
MGAYRSPEMPASTREAAPAPEAGRGSVEAREAAPQQGGGPVVVPALPTMPSLPPPPQAANSTTPQSSTQDSNPMIASDEDVIEKEWVDKAKKIVAQTKADPYTQEKEVSKLQADYIKKRYGKEIKLSSEQ